jgi:glycosyltransferase involved in cell wall biosynthesis
MKENIPLKVIPLPDYNVYKSDLCHRYNIKLPLKITPFTKKGNLAQMPSPLKQQKRGWPWDKESEIVFSKDQAVPKISVIIPSYEQGIYIEETIRSILLQNYPNLEIVIMDGGSTDETYKVLEYYKDFISAYISEKDRGQAHAINMGFSLASGDLYYWINSDDYLNINSLNKVVQNFMLSPNVDIVYGDGFTLNEQSQELIYATAPWVLERYLRFGSIVLSHSVIWKSNIHCALWEDLNCAMDAELWLRLFRNRRSRHCHFPIGTLRIHSEQKTSKMTLWKEQWKEDYEKFIWKWYPSIGALKWNMRVIEFHYVQKTYRILTGKGKSKNL